jgi:hypothetical protein
VESLLWSNLELGAKIMLRKEFAAGGNGAIHDRRKMGRSGKLALQLMRDSRLELAVWRDS